MAAAKCKKCRNEINTNASFCTRCGTKVERTTLLTKLVLGFIIFFVVVGIVSNMAQKEAGRGPAAEEASRLASLTAEQQGAEDKKREAELAAAAEREKQRVGLAWSYDEKVDAMDGRTIKWAMLESSNEISFEFPYQGPQRATLELRLHPRNGRSAFIQVERGQFLCGFENCQISARFDEGKAESFRAAEPADSRTTVLFILDFGRFVSHLKNAKKVAIEAQFFQQGTRIFIFNVNGLTWDQNGPPKQQP
jgi:hypothetical protein